LQGEQASGSLDLPEQLSQDEAGLVARLRAGDDSAFAELLDRYNGMMLRVAQIYVPSHAVAEEVVQDAWLGVIRGIGNFEGRSSLETWVFRILTNSAKTRGVRERRSIPFSSAWKPTDEPYEPAVPPERFRSLEDPYPRHWAQPYPRDWDQIPEERLLSEETRQLVLDAVDKLPASQKEVITLRDINGWSSAEVCNALGISETNQRVLLHRARSKVRLALAQYLGDE
jgi:RNA polymerase sigma-70 factor (ECF subfamily)